MSGLFVLEIPRSAEVTRVRNLARRRAGLNDLSILPNKSDRAG